MLVEGDIIIPDYSIVITVPVSAGAVFYAICNDCLYSLASAVLVNSTVLL